VSAIGAPARVGRLGLYAFLIGAALFFAIPLLVVISTSLKSLDEIRALSIFVPPASPNFTAWWKAWYAACTGLNCGGVHVGFWNSVRDGGEHLRMILQNSLDPAGKAFEDYSTARRKIRGRPCRSSAPSSAEPPPGPRLEPIEAAGQRPKSVGHHCRATSPRSPSAADPVPAQLGALRRDVDPVEASGVFTQDLPLDLRGQIYVVFLF
jgi:hypothetical protein